MAGKKTSKTAIHSGSSENDNPNQSEAEAAKQGAKLLRELVSKRKKDDPLNKDLLMKIKENKTNIRKYQLALSACSKTSTMNRRLSWSSRKQWLTRIRSGLPQKKTLINQNVMNGRLSMMMQLMEWPAGRQEDSGYCRKVHGTHCHMQFCHCIQTTQAS
jgi:hypothetical protein